MSFNVFTNPKTQTYAQALTIAGSDSGGGAGIQADLKTFQMRQVFGTSVITASTAQNTKGVWDIQALPASHIHAQLHAIKDDFEIGACKIGMLGSSDIIKTVANFLDCRPFGCVVLDPVMVAKGGQSLLDKTAINHLKELIHLADIITPNIPEAQILTNCKISDDSSIKQALYTLQEMGAKTVIIKGGHSQESQSTVCTDWILDKTGKLWYIQSPRTNTKNTHGTGCTFSACITAELAKGCDIKVAIETAKSLITKAIVSATDIGHGHGAVNHWAFWDE